MNIQSFREEYFNYIKRFNDITVKEPNEIIKYFLNSIITNEFFNKKGGEKYKLPQGKTLTNIHATEMSELNFDCDEFNIKTTDNVVIIGAGPIGLCIAILIKKYIPALDVIVLEKRQNDNKRNFEREQIVKSLGFGYEWHNEKKIIEIEKFFGNLNLGISIHADNYQKNDMYFKILPVSSYGYFSINKLEFELSQIAEELGILIVCENANIKTETDLERFINPQTLSIFDATGGRLDFNEPNWNNKKALSRKCSYLIGDINNLKDVQKMRRIGTETQTQYFVDTYLDFYYLNCSNSNPEIGDTVSPDPKINIDEIVTDSNKTKQGSFFFSDKGMNLNNIKKIKDIPLISIGDSFRSTDFTTGSGLQFGIFHSMICALILKKVHNDNKRYVSFLQKCKNGLCRLLKINNNNIVTDENSNIVTDEKEGGSKTKHHKKRKGGSKTRKRRKSKKAHK